MQRLLVEHGGKHPELFQRTSIDAMENPKIWVEHLRSAHPTLFIFSIMAKIQHMFL